MADIAHLDDIWTKFLELWPVEKVRAMTLEQYHTLNDPTCFVRCLESMTEMLGSIWGGSAFKFGIYQRDNTDRIGPDKSGHIYGEAYGWRTPLGQTPEQVFSTVKKNILGIIDAVQHKNLDAVSCEALWPMVAWKIAFLYQDRDDPQVLSVYRREKLIAALGEDTAKLSTAELYRRLMARRNGKNLHEYSEEIWNMPPQGPSDGKGKGTGGPQPAASGGSIPLNQILYGPPGTGKTYATVEKTLEIFAAAGMRDVGATREKKKQRFDELVADGHIRFVTFHQSFSYEDFVEGIRASTDEDGKITYQVEDGIFKELCTKASSRMERPHRQSVNLEGRTVWKMSLGNTQGDDASIYDECLQKNCLLMGYGGSVDFSACRTREEIRRKFEEELPEQLKDSMYPVRRVELFAHKMAVGDIVIISDGNHKFRAIGQISGPYQAIEREDDDYGQYRAVKWLCTFSPSRPTEELLRKKFTQLVLYPLTDAVLDRQRLARLLQVEQAEEEDRLPYVLIIDEINRGNISRIFGELITLVEASHRACLPGSPSTRDSISVRLPYSRESFSVPENVYIIGTMNTADRSLTGLDAALRRRFSFTEMPPRPELLESSRLHGTEFSLADLLTCLNRRITVLLDGDHCLGHAWFMGLGRVVTAEALAIVFRNHILPLLEEYFFEDWEKIQWILNDHRKEAENRFLLRDDTELSSLFGDDVQLPDRGQGWYWNQEAFGSMASYVQIIDAEVWPEPDDEDDNGHSRADEETATENFADLGERIDSVEWRGYRIERYRTRAGSNPIRVLQDGKYVGDRLVTQTLRIIAAHLGIELRGANTQSQGNFLIQKLKELGQKA
ncbi:AAA family ATPase [Desulfovibrio piger]|uniref:AAA family ATPase n=1 Tax=Desulfovibrio piger TaxID=901 RepID=UPI00242EC0B5|nr:AAA family ATPase [Desulfovibrio piger]